MQELNVQEIEQVSGAGTILDMFEDIREIIREIPNAFRELVDSTVDVACTISGDC